MGDSPHNSTLYFLDRVLKASLPLSPPSPCAETHYRALDRVLRDAAGSGGRDWWPGDRELEQAELVVALLSRLVPVRRREGERRGRWEGSRRGGGRV